MSALIRSTPIFCAATVLAAAGVVAACSGNPEPVKDPGGAGTATPTPTATPTATAIATPTASVAPTATATVAPVASAAPSAAPGCPAGMALIPGGTLAMGAPKKDVTVAPICLDVSETTADEYTECVKAGKCATDFLDCAPQHTYKTDGKGAHPINCVDFAQATSYCAFKQKRLPSSEEWEFAARGAEGRTYPWGNDKPADQLCWSGSQLHTGTCPVASSPKGDTPQGVHDLAGNVFEWTTSKADAKSTHRDGRGGSWKDGAPELLRPSRPGTFEVGYRCGFLGIRCAIEAPAGAAPAKK